MWGGWTLSLPILCSWWGRALRRPGGVSWGPLLRLSQGVTKHICTDLFTGHHARQAAALKNKQKKGNGADWFPGPDMSVNVGRSWCTELRWLPSLPGQQDTGPIPAPALASVLIPRHAQALKPRGSTIKEARTNPEMSHTTPNLGVPSPPPQYVKGKDCREGRRRRRLPAQPFPIFVNKYKTSGLRPATTNHSVPAAWPGWGRFMVPSLRPALPAPA